MPRNTVKHPVERKFCAILLRSTAETGNGSMKDVGGVLRLFVGQSWINANPPGNHETPPEEDPPSSADSCTD